MADPKTIPPAFQSQNTAIATYDYLDISDGTGITVFYGYDISLSGANSYNLSRDAVYSFNVEYNIATGSIGTSYSKIADLDWDLSAFNNARTIKGTLLASIPFKILNTEDKSYSAFFRVRVRKYDGSTETEIADSYSTVIQTSNFQSIAKNVLVPVTIPSTTYSKGDILRVTLELWGSKQSGATGTMHIGHDPAGRDGTNIIPGDDDIPTTLKFHVPFRIEL